MKIAVLADIHANYRALQATVDHIETWRPDFVIIAGDTINRGPNPQKCLSLILNRREVNDWRLIRGNHEDYVLSQAAENSPRDGPIADVHRASIWTYEQIEKNINPLLRMKFKLDLIDAEANLIRTVHASMLGNRIGVYPETKDEDLRCMIWGQNSRNESQPRVFCVGHTHRPLERIINQTLVVNAGSVGLPFDGDNRACYARLERVNSNWESTIIRLRYDIGKAIDDFTQTGYLTEGGPLVKLVLLELLTAKSHLYNWAKDFQSNALQGKITMKDSVERYLADINLPAGIHL